MQALERRISALEKANPPDDGLTVIRRFVSADHVEAEIQRLSANDGQHWTRHPGETERELIDRASSEVKRTLQGFACLTAHD